MRAESSRSVQGAKAELPPPKPKQPFARALARARPPPAAATSAIASRSAGHAVTARELQRARAGHAAEAHRLGEVRTEREPAPAIPRAARERLERALEPERPPPPVVVPPPSAPGQPTMDEAGGAPAPRVTSALQLVERIEVFLRSGRPQLELSVGGQLRAEVLLERTGPREVAVTLRGRNGPPPPHELARIREQLRHRGLKLSSMAIE